MTPRLPGQSRQEREQAQNTGTWIALVFASMIAVGFLGLILLIMPDLIWLPLIVAGFGLFIALHYFTWGAWLMRHRQNDDEDEDQ